MKLQQLIISAFGPYANKQILDFETNLNGKNMFVISGNTGAGKTTIFDAINFALYGNASGSERDGKSLRSDFASPDTDTEVELWFSIRNKEYYIKRCPQYERPKLRGDGITKKSAYAEMKCITDNKVLTGYNDVSSEVEKILGINSAQFKQLVMIPQGEFKKLLNADSKEKELIFRKIFSTETFEQIQKQIVEKANILSSQIGDFQKNKANAVQRFIYEDEITKELLSAQVLNYDAILKQFGLISSADESNKLELQKQLEVLNRELENLKETLVKEEKYQNSLLVLNKRKTYFEDLSKEITNLIIILKDSEIELQTQKKREVEKLQLTKNLDKLLRLKAKTVEFSQTETLLKQLYSEIKNLENTSFEVQKKYTETESSLKSISEDIDKITNLSLENLKLENELLSQRELYSKINSLITNSDKFKELICKHSEEAQHFQKIEAEFKAAKTNFETIDDDFKKNKAGILAATLNDGCPCPVCGALEHPSPAKLDTVAISEQDVKQAKLNFDKFTKLRDHSFQSLTALKQNADSIKENLILPSLKEILKLDEFEAIDDFYKKLSLMKTEITEKGKLTKASFDENAKIIVQKDKLLAQKKEAEALLVTLRENENSAQKNLEFKKIDASAIKEKLNAISLEFDGEIQKLEQLENQEKEIKSAIKIIEETLSKAEQNHNNLKTRFDNLSGQKSAVESEIIELEAQSATLKTEFEAMLVNFEEIRVSEILAQKKHEYQTLENEIKNLEFKILNNQRIIGEIQALSQNTTKLEEEFRTIGYLANIIKGENAAKTSFERYVLSSYYEDIINAANLRFSKMTTGRFELSRKQEVSDARKKSGLDLEVFDNYTGKSRDVKTLSGGEAFKASLSMALGLADVVQSYAGGIQLDTMFIDEGFGTLDPESLDKAIECLIELQYDQRVVGIISHVPELKERIDAKLEVSMTSSGSRAEFKIN